MKMDQRLSGLKYAAFLATGYSDVGGSYNGLDLIQTGDLISYAFSRMGIRYPQKRDPDRSLKVITPDTPKAMAVAAMITGCVMGRCGIVTLTHGFQYTHLDTDQGQEEVISKMGQATHVFVLLRLDGGPFLKCLGNELDTPEQVGGYSYSSGNVAQVTVVDCLCGRAFLRPSILQNVE